MKSKNKIKQKDAKKKKKNLKHWTTKMMNTMNIYIFYVNEEPQCKTWQRTQWYGWWITQNKNVTKQGDCIVDANMNLNMTKDILPQILRKMRMKCISCWWRWNVSIVDEDEMYQLLQKWTSHKHKSKANQRDYKNSKQSEK